MFLTDKQNLEFMCSRANVLAMFSHYQKKNAIRFYHITWYNLPKVKLQLDKLQIVPLLGGWKSTLEEYLKNCNEDEEGTLQIHGIQLQEETRRKWRKIHHLYVREAHTANAVINDTVETFKNVLHTRFAIDEVILLHTVPFITLQPKVDLSKVQEIWKPDISLETLNLEYTDLLMYDDIVKSCVRTMSLKNLVCHLLKSSFFKTVLTILAWVLAAKPHSAAVERLISQNNIWKTSMRGLL